jgi:hypothetical protein
MNELWELWENLPYQKNRLVTGTNVKNYLMNDPLIDWFNEYANVPINKSSSSSYNHNHNSKSTIVSKISKKTKRSKKSKKSKSSKTFKNEKTIKKIIKDINNDKQNVNILYKYGNDFEDKIISELKLRYNVCTINTNKMNGYNEINYKKTIKAIKSNKYDIIYQGVFLYRDRSIGGSPDIIAKGYVINDITKNMNIMKNNIEYVNYIPDSELNSYFIIDIKWSTIPLCTSNNLIRNEGLYPAYKGQIAIYNYILGKITGKYKIKGLF